MAEVPAEVPPRSPSFFTTAARDDDDDLGEDARSKCGAAAAASRGSGTMVARVSEVCGGHVKERE